MSDLDHKYFLYVCKSTDDTSRQQRSLEDQFAELREMACRKKLRIVAEFSEKQSAKTPGRPIFNQMLDRIEAGEAQGILAWHPDRLSRNSLDGGRLIYLVDTKKLLDLQFPIYHFEPTAHGKLMLAFSFGMSKYYVDNLSENIKRGQRQKSPKESGRIERRSGISMIRSQGRSLSIRSAVNLFEQCSSSTLPAFTRLMN